jgi:predicted TIM-barrel fold metal-dependent hydrolase
MTSHRSFSRREFLATSAAALAGCTCSALADDKPAAGSHAKKPIEPIIDIHQHTNYGGARDKNWNQIQPARSDEQLLAHQKLMGVTQTILLPSGRPVIRASTHEGRSNGLESTCTGNDACMTLAKAHPGEYLFGANEVSDLDEAPSVVEKYLKLGAVIIAEQKFGVECDSIGMQKLYKLAEEYHVPILMHWQVGSYNYGFERFSKILEKYPKVTFIGHAQTWWANIDKNCDNNPKNLYPKGPVTPGGLTDKYLSDYPNMFGDLSAGSGLNAFKRDNDHGRAFLERHQDKLVYGSDCTDTVGRGAGCSGAQQIAMMRKLSPSKAIERKVLYENAKKLFRL